jgi:hypothetical protein
MPSIVVGMPLVIATIPRTVVIIKKRTRPHTISAGALLETKARLLAA